MPEFFPIIVLNPSLHCPRNNSLFNPSLIIISFKMRDRFLALAMFTVWSSITSYKVQACYLPNENKLQTVLH